MKCEGFGCEERAEDGTKLVGCDTIYAVNREHYSHKWKAIDKSDELLEILKEYELPKKPVDIVLTGGEPLLYANDAIFIEFLEALHVRGHRICFETNGSLGVNFDAYPIYKECVFALSVKLENSGESFKKRANPEILHSLCSNSKEAFFKFSIGRDSLEKALEDELDKIIEISPDTEVFCMPLGGSKKEIEENSDPLVEFCKLKGYNFSDRLHIRIWDKEKGI
jgi:organic radical activating enzyme